jgi:hypothetical protein
MGSVRRRGGMVRVSLEPTEVVLLASLVGQVRQLLIDGLPEGSAEDSPDPLQELIGLRSADTQTPEDPVLARLLPDAYREDPEAAGEYRRLMDSDLRLQKAAALQQVVDDLAGGGSRRGGEQRFELSDDVVMSWLFALTDVRLTLGTTLDVSEDMEDERASLEPDSPRYAGLVVYDWVSWLQDAIVRVATV